MAVVAGVLAVVALTIGPLGAQEPDEPATPPPTEPASEPADEPAEPAGEPGEAEAVVPVELPQAVRGESAWEAVEPVARLRYPEITPDGQTVVISYENDLFRVPITGGHAIPITGHVGREIRAVTSPDGREMFFAGNFYGNYDVFAVSILGGHVRQVTFNDAHEFPCTVSPDGAWLVFYSWDDGTTDLFLTRTDGTGTPIRLTDTMYVAEYGARFSPDGKYLALCIYGSTTGFFRPDYRGANDGEIWVAELDGAALTNWTRITDNDWHDSDPNWFVRHDGRPMLVYTSFGPQTRGLFVCDPFGPVDLETGIPESTVVYRTPNFSRPLRCPSVAMIPSGFVAIVEDGLGGLKTVRVVSDGADGDGGSFGIPEVAPVPVVIAPVAKISDTLRVDTTGDLSEFRVSPDGKKIAFVVNGDVFVTAADGSTEGVSLRVTDTPERELQVAWAPDSLRIYYTTLRRGKQDIVVCDIATGDERFLVATDADECAAVVAPDGSRIAYVRNETELRLVKPDGTDDSLVLAGMFPRQGLSEVTAYQFSPDSQWLAVSVTSDADLKREIFIAAVDGSLPALQVTAFSGSCFQPTWTPDGKFLTFSAYVNNDYDAYALELKPKPAEFPEDKLRQLFPRPEPPQKAAPAAARPAGEAAAAVKKVPPVEIDFDEILHRARPVTTLPGHEWNLLLCGDQWVFLSNLLNGYQFWSLPQAGGTLKQLTNIPGGKDYVQLSADGKTIFFLRQGRIQRMVVATGAVTAIPTRAQYNVDRLAERLAVYEEIGWVMSRYFYDPGTAQNQWRTLHDSFRPAVLGCTEDDEFRSVVSELLGQLNYSHLGIGARPGGTPGISSVNVGALGVRFDTEQQFRHGHLKITQVIANSPADAPAVKLLPGEYIRAVGGQPLDASANLHRLLLGQTGARVEITVGNAPPGEAAETERTVIVKPVSRMAIHNLRYEEWVRHNREIVEALSDGDFGYVHVRSMDGASLTRFRNEVAGMMTRKKGIVIDVRNNGGGSTAVNILDILYKETWLLRTYRDFGRVSENMYRAEGWEKPAAALINQNSFSNAEIFAEGFRRLRIGPLIGMPTGGGVIGTSGYTLVDGSSIRLPFAGAFTVDMQDLERNPRVPDVWIDETPDDRQSGRDHQLEVAVRELRKQSLYFEAHGVRPYARQPRADIEPHLERMFGEWNAAAAHRAGPNNGDGDGTGDGTNDDGTAGNR